MTHVDLSRKKIFAIFIGFLVIVGMGIITSTVSFLVFSKTVFSEQPVLIVKWILKIISFVSPILGGVVVGWIIKKKSWLYGGLLGVLLQLISIRTVSFTFFLPTSLIYGPLIPVEYGHNLAFKNILGQLLDTPITVVLTSLGGWLGEGFYKRRKNRKIYH